MAHSNPSLATRVGSDSENEYHFSVRCSSAPLVVVLGFAGFGLTGCGASARAATTPPTVVATTTQTADFARVISGGDVQVYDVMRAGVDPHHYEPTAADLHQITGAAVIVTNGLGLEPWFARAQRATTPKGIVVTATSGVTLRGNDPHVWLNPANAKIMVTNVADAMTRALPSLAPTFTANLAVYTAELEALDQEISAQVSALPNRKMVTNHDAFGYFIERYGFDYVGSVIPSFDTSTDLSTNEVRKLVSKIKAEQVRAVFSEASVPPKAARAIATEAGVKIVDGEDALFGDSLGAVGSDGDTYLKMMRHNARTIVMALS
jgi:zinc/manganese transport system substrate-binding protein